MAKQEASLIMCSEYLQETYKELQPIMFFSILDNASVASERYVWSPTLGRVDQD